MTAYPALRRWAAALVTATFFAGLVALVAWTGGANSKDAQQPKEGGAGGKPTAWPMFGGHLSRNMVNTIDRDVPVQFDPENVKFKNILWKADLGSKAYGGPIVADGKVFIGSNNQHPRDPKDIVLNPQNGKKEAIDKGVMMCFDAKTGKF